MSISLIRTKPFIVASILSMTSIVVGARTAHAQAQADEAADEAKKYFETGVGYLEDPDGERIEEAYYAFKRAYDLSKSPKVLGNIGLCAMRLERDGEAIDAYTEYLKLPDIDADERAQIERDLRSLSTSTARITITVDQPNTVILDSRTAVRGDAVTNTYGPIAKSVTLRMRQGHHVVRVKRDGMDRGVWEFDAKPGDALAHYFHAEPVKKVHDAVPVANDGVHPAAWLLTGVGSAALAAGAVTGFMTRSAVSDLEHQCPNNVCPPGYDLNAKRDSTQTLATVTNSLLLGGGLLAAAGVTWLIAHEASTPSQKPRADHARRTAPKISAGAACLPGACAVSIGLRL